MAKQRLDKVLSRAGLGSRKEVKRLVKAGRVSVNGSIATDGGQHVDPDVDKIEVNDRPIVYREWIYLMMYKPKGVITATVDPVLPTVLDLLDGAYAAHSPFPVGRLDRYTEGLLLLTNDGSLAHRLLSPKYRVPKTYAALIRGHVTEQDVAQFAAGIVLEDGTQTQPAILKVLEPGAHSRVEVTIYEGKFHQVKRMFRAVGKQVVELKRLSMGPLVLDPALSPGQYRHLTADEVQMLKKTVGQGD
ncbi:MAG: 16S rRNA pseudouridine(516) synthase [Bacillus thermozeamaize]|uniref:Pseudouridine synthase n=1 Tax=Bacillus thermozeamaize TaxID=230954 RepID=A0A1Y3PTT4_9BACI|nr:MAG: 16S rRNA pseudouridine(516) synthase [Bacillus thermozeamaize]